MKAFTKAVAAMTAALCCSIPAAVHAGLVGSKHDLSTPQTPQPCVFCHTPHNAATGPDAPGPLWNRKIDDMTKFVAYTSPTMNGTCANTPSAMSLACLSCHDGVSARGMASAVTASTHSLLVYPKASAGYMPKCLGCHGGADIYPAKTWQIGPDLSDDHPISLVYPQPGTPGFNTAPDQQKGWPDIKLYNGRIECSTCHNPHDTTFPTFLRKLNTGSAVCYTCHNK